MLYMEPWAWSVMSPIRPGPTCTELKWTFMTFISTGPHSQVPCFSLPLYNIRKDEPKFYPKFQSTPCLCHLPLGLHRTAVRVVEVKPPTCEKYQDYFCHNFCIEQLTKVFQKEGYLNLKPEELVDIRYSMKRGRIVPEHGMGKCNLPRGNVVLLNNQKFSVVVINCKSSGAR